MASMQCHRESAEHSTFHSQKTTAHETCHDKANNEHSFANKVKGMANSACKVFTHHGQHHHDGQNAHHGAAKNHDTHVGKSQVHQSTACHDPKPNGHAHSHAHAHGHASATTTHDKKNNMIANIGEHIKKNVKKKKSHKAGKCNDNSSDSSSSDESDNDTCAKKN